MTRHPRTPEHFPRMKHRAAGRRLGLRGHPTSRAAARLHTFIRHEIQIAESLAAFLESILPLNTPRRRLRVNHCSECIDELLTPDAPHHDPHPACQAGSYDHCTCTTCH